MKAHVVHGVKYSTHQQMVRHTYCGLVIDCRAYMGQPSILNIHSRVTMHDGALSRIFNERWCKKCASNPLAMLRNTEL